MKYFFEPKTVALIGATPNKEKASYVIFKNLKNYSGKIFLVNPKYKEIEGFKCYPSVLDIKEKLDLCVVVVNAKIANKVIAECFEKGVKGAVVITAGYKEIGGEGVERERELKKLLDAYNYKTRIVGPNCLGILDNISGLDILFIDDSKVKKPRKGNISLFFQSGALGEGVIDELADEGVGIARFISYGNAVDVNECDAVSFYSEDKHTKVIGGYIEGLRNGKKFYELIKNVKKPVILIKGGKGKKGGEAVATHTGSIASNYKVFKNILENENAIVEESFQEFKNTLKIFSYLPKPSASNLFIITNGGGYGVLAVDEAEKQNITLYELTENDKVYFKTFLPSHATPHNPLDLIGDASPDRYDFALKHISRLKGVGVVLVIVLAQTFAMNEQIVEVIKKYSPRKPLVVVMQGSSYVKHLKYELQTHNIPVYETPEEAVKAIKRYLFYYGKVNGLKN